jgi:MYXO-CTERM domain-containing protein
LPAGMHSITATYSGDANFSASASTRLTETIGAGSGSQAGADAGSDSGSSAGTGPTSDAGSAFGSGGGFVADGGADGGRSTPGASGGCSCREAPADEPGDVAFVSLLGVAVALHRRRSRAAHRA